jgi:hypothetical protein
MLDREAYMQKAMEFSNRAKSGADVASLVFVHLAQRSDEIDAVTIAEHAGLFPTWSINWTGKAGNIVRASDGQLYRSIHAISAGQNTDPVSTPAMWTRIADPAEEWPAWSQPIGAHDAYKMNARVSHNNGHWISSSDGNVWEPGVYGWSEATKA